MTMGTLGKTIKATRTTLIESEADKAAEDFHRIFRLRDGDYIRYWKKGGAKTSARIFNVQEVFWNGAGCYTADISVIPLRSGGKIGSTRRLLLVINANGTNLRGVHYCHYVERIKSN